ncbi:WD40-like Beta Propeller Repeat [Lysobacter sp. cf310]|nr:WD40-like Beta Propeller Repeat [Lysobacter sp. cf310]
MGGDIAAKDTFHRALVFGLLLAAGTSSATVPAASDAAPQPAIEILDAPTVFAPGIASTKYADIRLTLSPDGRTALWFSRDRPGGAGGYDIWVSRRDERGWSEATPVPFNSPGRDFDPAFSADGRSVYFCSDRPGGLGADDLWRVAVTGTGFGEPEHLGAAVNSAGKEYAPMLSADGQRLLFSSDRPGGAGQLDLYLAQRRGAGFAAARRLSGGINTGANDFDASYLADDRSIVYSRAQDFRTDRVDLYLARPRGGGYDAGQLLPPSVNSRQTDSYGPMLDWSQRDRLLYSAQRDGAQSMELYLVRYRLLPSAGDAAGKHADARP